MKSSLHEILSCIPGTATEQFPAGERYAVGLSHGTMSVGYYAPVDYDPQVSHKHDELYIIHTGSGTLIIDGVVHTCNRGDVFFVASGVEHRFVKFTQGFGTWFVFWGPAGGEVQA